MRVFKCRLNAAVMCHSQTSEWWTFETQHWKCTEPFSDPRDDYQQSVGNHGARVCTMSLALPYSTPYTSLKPPCISRVPCRKSYKPSKNGAICASAYLLCAQRFYRSAIFDRTFAPTLIALCVADRSGKKVLCANFIANPVLHRAQRFYLQR